MYIYIHLCFFYRCSTFAQNFTSYKHVVPWKGAAGCTCEETKGVGRTPRAHAIVWVNIPYELICAVGTTPRARTIISVDYPHTYSI